MARVWEGCFQTVSPGAAGSVQFVIYLLCEVQWSLPGAGTRPARAGLANRKWLLLRSRGGEGVAEG